VSYTNSGWLQQGRRKLRQQLMVQQQLALQMLPAHKQQQAATSLRHFLQFLSFIHSFL
jgi:hypothetical protein